MQNGEKQACRFDRKQLNPRIVWMKKIMNRSRYRLLGMLSSAELNTPLELRGEIKGFLHPAYIKRTGSVFRRNQSWGSFRL
jgi:hypothetical protein